MVPGAMITDPRPPRSGGQDRGSDKAGNTMKRYSIPALAALLPSLKALWRIAALPPPSDADPRWRVCVRRYRLRGEG